MEETKEEFPAQWALDLLEPTPLDRSNHIFKYYAVPPSIAAFSGAVMLRNAIEKKPLTANKPHILLAAAFGFVLGCGIHWISDIRFARKDAIMRDYIMRHPERFPKPEIKKYKDIFEEWVPVR